TTRCSTWCRYSDTKPWSRVCDGAGGRFVRARSSPKWLPGRGLRLLSRAVPGRFGPHLEPAAHGDPGPDQLDHPEGPGSGEEAVGTGEDAADREGEDERRPARLERVHQHHESH